MQYRNHVLRRFGVLCLLASSLLLVASRSVSAQGQFSPVSDANVVDLKFNHYFTPDTKSHDADFEWTFTKTEFLLKKGKGAIPADLLEQLLPKKPAGGESVLDSGCPWN